VILDVNGNFPPEKLTNFGLLLQSITLWDSQISFGLSNSNLTEMANTETKNYWINTE